MNTNDPTVLAFIQRSMVARIATLSRNGRPSINPLYFLYLNDRLWLGTTDWTLAARNVKANPHVSVLFEVERDPSEHRVLRVSGPASVQTDPTIMRSYNQLTVRRYILTPGGIRNFLLHLRRLWPMHKYHAQSAEKGLACVIEVLPEQVEFLNDPQFPALPSARP